MSKAITIRIYTAIILPIIRIFRSRRMRWEGLISQMGEKRNVYRLLVGKPEGKRPLGRSTRRWVDNITMTLAQTRLGGLDWIGLAKDRNKWRVLVKLVMNLRALYSSGKLSSGYTTDGISGNAQLHRISYSKISHITTVAFEEHQVTAQNTDCTLGISNL
jgi:hypothetical protein